MYEIIRVKEGDRQFEISVPQGTHADFEIMSAAFLNALKQYTEMYTELHGKYYQLQAELHIHRMKGDRDSHHYDPPIKNPCTEIYVKDNYGDTVGTVELTTPLQPPVNILKEAREAAAKKMAEQMDKSIMKTVMSNDKYDWGSSWKK